MQLDSAGKEDALIGLINDCCRIEKLTGEIYTFLAREGGYREPVRQAFQRLADDERDHARQLESAISTLRPETSAVQRISWVKVDELLVKTQELRDQVRRALPSEEGALRLALELERALVKIHLDQAVHFDDSRVASLFQGLGRSDEEHLATLRSCLEWWHKQPKLQG